MAVEAKSGESLDRLVNDWLGDISPTSGKPRRLEFLRECLGLQGVDVGGLRYQLLHRAASALVQAERYRASLAILLVQSFGGARDAESRSDYARFAEAMGCAPAFDALVGVGRQTKIPLLVGWVEDVPARERAPRK